MSEIQHIQVWNSQRVNNNSTKNTDLSSGLLQCCLTICDSAFQRKAESRRDKSSTELDSSCSLCFNFVRQGLRVQSSRPTSYYMHLPATLALQLLSPGSKGMDHHTHFSSHLSSEETMRNHVPTLKLLRPEGKLFRLGAQCACLPVFTSEIAQGLSFGSIFTNHVRN